MNPHNPQPDEPIRALAEQEVEPSSRFLQRVRSRIYRRTAASQLASYSWHLPKVILLEMVGVFSHVVKALATSKERGR